MTTRVKSYRINTDENVRKGDAIVIGDDGEMTGQHLGTAASLDNGTCPGNVPILDSNGKLPDSLTPTSVMKKCVYDPHPELHEQGNDVFDYDNFYNTPTIPEVYDPTITFVQGGVNRGSISLNQASGGCIELLAGGVEAGKGTGIINNCIDVNVDECSVDINSCNKLCVVDYDTIKSGAAAGATAVQANDLATVAITGNYCDLINKPEIPSAQIQSDWAQTNVNLADYIKNKPTIGNATITLQKNGTNVDCFELNQTANKCLNLTLNKCDVGLNNVDNTSDADKPVSDATQCALNCKQDNISDLNTIRSNACAGKTASETIANYGDIVSHNSCEYATATQGGKADSAVQPGDLCAVATSGKYCDLSGQPTIPTDNCQLANSCGYTTCTGTLVSSDLNPYAKTCTLCSVATSGKYCDLTGQPTIPTDNCQLANSCNYITNAVNDLQNYYLKCETYQKCEVDNLISNFGGFEVVSTLPSTNIKTNVIYLLGPIGTGADKYEEWIYYNNTWTKIGETTTDLSNYAKCCDIPTDNCQLGNSCGYTTCTGTLVSSDLNPYAKTCTLCTVATSGKYCDLTGLPTIPTNNNQLTNGCGYTTCTGTLVSSDLAPYAKSCDLKAVATSGKYCDLTGTPSLAAVATSGCYNDLSGKPSLCTVATSGCYSDLSGAPSLATVATSGCYNDLTGKPTIPTDNCQLGNSCNYITKDVTNLTCYTPTASLATVATSGAYCDLSGTPSLACVACSGSYEDLICKPNLGVYQITANMVCSLTNADNTHYPSAKAVADALSSCGAGDMMKVTYDPNNKNADAFDYTNFINTPNLCAVATSGKYCDLTGTPTIPAALTSGCAIGISSNKINVQYDGTTIKKNSGNCLYADFTGLATTTELACKADSSSLCAVATSGKYCDLTGKPTIPTDNCQLSNSCGYTTCTGTLVASDLNDYAKSADVIKCKSTTGSQTVCTTASGCTTAFGVKSNATSSYISLNNCSGWLASIGATSDKKPTWYNGTGHILAYAEDIPTDNCQLTNGCCYAKTSDINTKAFTLSSTSDTTNASAAAAYINGGSNAIIILNNVAYNLSSKSSTQMVFKGPVSTTANTSDTSLTQATLTFTVSGNSVTAISNTSTSLGKYLQTDRNYGTAYTPLYNGSPATKKYVDDCVGSINSAEWGNITGTMACQTDLQGALNCKADCTAIPTDNCQLANSCGYTTCTGTLVASDLNCYAQCCDFISKTNTTAFTPTGDYNPATKLYVDTAVAGAGGGDMCYSDFNFVSKTGATVTLDLSSEITPSANFTVNVPSTIKEGQTYVLRVSNGATPYTMTLGTNINNPWGVDLTLTPNGIDQFVFYASSSSALELQKDYDDENVFVTQDAYDALPSTKLTDGKTYFIYEE